MVVSSESALCNDSHYAKKRFSKTLVSTSQILLSKPKIWWNTNVAYNIWISLVSDCLFCVCSCCTHLGSLFKGRQLVLTKVAQHSNILWKIFLALAIKILGKHVMFVYFQFRMYVWLLCITSLGKRFTWYSYIWRLCVGCTTYLTL